MKYKGRICSLAISLILTMVIAIDTYLVYGSFNLVEIIHIALIYAIMTAVLWFAGGKYDSNMLYAYNDALTGVYNRRFVCEAFPKMVSQISSDYEKLGLTLPTNKFGGFSDD